MRDKDGKAFSDASLLLAEDDPLNADIASRTLRKLGCRVVVASDGLAATRMWEDGDFDLILMDCEMAEMDGFEASRRIREREKQSNRRHTPIVALSAHAPAEIRERCIAAGMDEVLAKPFREALLKDTLRSLIAGENPRLRDDSEHEPASEADPTMPVDRSVLDGVSAFQGGNGQLLLRNLVARFADTARTQLSLLRKGQSDGASEDIRRIAHTLKSSSAALGAKCVSRCCAEIELRAGRGELAPLPAFLSALEEELSAAVGQLREIAGEREELHRAAG
jgi:CheY-like chemotaxis protein/HPt (histidine-containing phosphotransfer) domain-containing protein